MVRRNGETCYPSKWRVVEILQGRKCKSKCGAGTRLRFKCNFSFMSFHNFFCNGEPKSGSARFCGKIGYKNPILVFRHNSLAFIRNLNFNGLANFLTCDVNISFSGFLSLNSILDQIDENSPKFIFNAAYFQLIICEIAFNRYILIMAVKFADGG